MGSKFADAPGEVSSSFLGDVESWMLSHSLWEVEGFERVLVGGSCGGGSNVNGRTNEIIAETSKLCLQHMIFSFT